MIRLPLIDVIKKWANALVNSQELLDFCEEKYQKPPTIFIAYDAEHPPTQDDHPLVILHYAKKTEGEQIDQYNYFFMVDWGVMNSKATRTGNLVEFEGYAEANQMGEIILDVISNVSNDYPIAKVDFDIEPELYFPIIPGQMKIYLDIEISLGMDINY